MSSDLSDVRSIVLGLSTEARPNTHTLLNNAGFLSANLNIFCVFGLFSIISIFPLSFKISSLQICVALKGCVNDCKSCIAKMSGDSDLYSDHSKLENFNDLYIDKLKQVKDQGCKSIVITSDKGEPMQNKIFMEKIGVFNKQLDNWFNLEIQTTGVFLDDNNLTFLKDKVGVNIISVSVFDIFDDDNNLDIIGVKKKMRFNLKEVFSALYQFAINSL